MDVIGRITTLVVAAAVVAGVVVGVKSMPDVQRLPEDAEDVARATGFWSPVSATSSSATTASVPR